MLLGSSGATVGSGIGVSSASETIELDTAMKAVNGEFSFLLEFILLEISEMLAETLEATSYVCD